MTRGIRTGIAFMLLGTLPIFAKKKPDRTEQAKSITSFDVKTGLTVIRCPEMVLTYPEAIYCKGFLRTSLEGTSIDPPHLLCTYSQPMEYAEMERAKTGKGEPLQLIPIDRKFEHSAAGERYLVILPLELLRRQKSPGLRVLMFGKKGSANMLITQRLIDIFLEAVRLAELEAAANATGKTTTDQSTSASSAVD